MVNNIKIVKIYPESFRANLYSSTPFRMIGLIDVKIEYPYGIERVTLAYYRSSGTNNGKIKGLWYPIVGIKTYRGRFTEFSEYLNFVLRNTSRADHASRGWLAKSLFFAGYPSDRSKIRGFSNGTHYYALLKIGKALRTLYNENYCSYMKTLNPATLNSILTSTTKIYQENRHTQRENFEKFIADIFMEYFTSFN